MSAQAPQIIAQMSCGSGLGTLNIVGEHHGVVTLCLERFEFEDNALAMKKILSKFNDKFNEPGQCIFTHPFGTKESMFIFTVNIGKKIENSATFLQGICKELQIIVTEIKIING